MKMIYLFKQSGLFIAALLCITISAQTPKEKATNTLNKVNAVLSKAGSVSMTVTHKFYNTHDDTKPADIFNGFYKKSKGRLHSSLMGIETYESKDIKVSVDTGNTSVVVSPVTNPTHPVPDLKSALGFCSNIVVENKDSSVEEIQLWFDAAQYPMSRIVIQVKNDLIVKLVLYHSETTEDEEGKTIKPKTEIYFTNIKIDGNIASSEFDFSSIVNKKSGNYQLAPKYNEYKLINLIPKN